MIRNPDALCYTGSPMPRVLLAYSGSLNTTLAIPWLIQERGCEVITFAANLGYG